MERKAFNINEGKGFSIVFPNGITLSTQFGPGNYCNNHNLDIRNIKIPRFTTCDNCEIAVWKEGGDWITKEMWKDVKDMDLNNDVAGHVSIETWMSCVTWCINHK